MKIEFANDDLARILTDKAHKMGLPFVVIKATRNTLIKLESATCEQDLFAIGGLDYKIRKGGNNDIKAPLKIPSGALNRLESGRRDTGIRGTSDGPNGLF